MDTGWIDNRAGEIPFAGIVAELLAQNLARDPAKQTLLARMRGSVTLALTDIETEVTLVFGGARVRIEAGFPGDADLVVRTTTEWVMDLNRLAIVGGLPWCFDAAGRRVLCHLVTGRVKIRGIWRHPLLLMRLTRVLSVMV